MTKILSQTGISLADTYDVEGSIAGIEQLESREVSLVHEMGGTIFSERLSGAIRRVTTGAILQNAAWDLILTDLPAVPTRVLGVVVFSDDDARISRAMVAIRDPLAEREIPIFVWDANEATVTVRMQDNGAAVTTENVLANALGVATLPSMLIGSEQPQPVDQVAFRGLTTGFGAGTVVTTALIYIGFSQVGGISSHGLPVPAW